jgi:hypothetical protein
MVVGAGCGMPPTLGGRSVGTVQRHVLFRPPTERRIVNAVLAAPANDQILRRKSGSSSGPTGPPGRGRKVPRGPGPRCGPVRGRPSRAQASAPTSKKSRTTITQAILGRLRTRSFSDVIESKMAQSQKMTLTMKNTPPSLSNMHLAYVAKAGMADVAPSGPTSSVVEGNPRADQSAGAAGGCSDRRLGCL